MTAKCLPFDWKSFPSNTWVKLQTCGDAPRKVFHGAASLAADRNEVFFFGADTHDVDYDNSVTRFQLENVQWTKDYEPDPVKTYQVTPEGYPRTSNGRPWAHHAFDSFDYHPPSRRFLFVGFPKHAHFAKRQLQENGVTLDALRPATWWYDPDKKQWELLKISSPNLFAHGLVWHSVIDQFIGHDGSSTFHFDPMHQMWKTYPSPSIPGWHQRLVWETRTGQILSLGNNTGNSDLWTYSLPHLQWEKITVKETPLPANGAAIAYDVHQEILLYIANNHSNSYNNPSGKSVTFLYRRSTGSWTKLSLESPPLFGMNYLTQYDPVRHVFLHFEKTSQSDDQLAVWALRWERE
ncbi:MAG: hypothetical protein OEZ05_16955 [Nitrospirota bacterium]|nr:hypothetical protein [Nitrospirota bacterium]